MSDENKKIYSGNWPCSSCGGSITELPFEPKNTSNLTCRECYAKNKPSQSSERKMYSGDWSCSGCGQKITELPFEPRDTNNLTCRDCYMKSR